MKPHFMGITGAFKRWSAVFGDLGHATAVKVYRKSIDMVRIYMDMVHVVGNLHIKINGSPSFGAYDGSLIVQSTRSSMGNKMKD